MKMSEYLREIEHAATNVLELIWDEVKQLKALETEVARLTAQVALAYSRAALVAADTDDPDDVALGTGMTFDTYFGPDKDRYHKDEELRLVQAKVATHEFSRSALAGSLLQYAKQGISLCHAGLGNCPSGRAIGSQHLKDVIWNARNQAIHWEEGNLHGPTKACFDNLAKDFGLSFSNYHQRSLAFDVVELIKWISFQDFERDMGGLA